MDTRITSSNQQRSCGKGWSSGHGLPARGYWVRNQLCSAREALPNRTSATEWADPCTTWDSGGAIGATSRDYLQLRQYVASSQSQRV